MANQILAGAVINASMGIAGVDADNPPVTSSTPQNYFQASLSDWTIVAGSVSEPTSGTFGWTRDGGSGWVAGYEVSGLTVGTEYTISYEMRKTGGPGPVEMRVTPAVGGGETLTNNITESSDFVTFTSTWTQPDQTTAYVNIISDNGGGSGEIRNVSIVGPIPEPAPAPAPAPSLGDPFPHAGDIKATGAPSPFHAHYENANDWLTYGVFSSQPYGAFRGKPRIVPNGTPAGAIHFLRYDLDNEMLYAYVSYATSGGIGPVLEDLGFGSGYGLFYSFWQNGGNNTGAYAIGSYFPVAVKKSMTEAEFDALEFYWDEDGGQSGQGSWRINPEVVPPTQPVPATSVTDASFYSVTASDGQAVVHNGRRDIGGQWVSYGLGEGWFGAFGSREKIIEDGTWTEGAIHYLRYDPISKRIWAFWSYEGTPGAFGTLEQYGFGGYSVDDPNAFFDGNLQTNMTDFHYFPSGYFGKMIGSKEQYEVEDLAGLGISWNGTSWTKAQASLTTLPDTWTQAAGTSQDWDIEVVSGQSFSITIDTGTGASTGINLFDENDNYVYGWSQDWTLNIGWTPSSSGVYRIRFNTNPHHGDTTFSNVTASGLASA